MAIRPTQSNLDEFVQLPAGIVAANLNPEFWVARANDLLGGFKQYNTLEEFVQLHPNKMVIGMEASINQHERTLGVFRATKVKLDKIPDLTNFPLSISPNQLDVNGNEILVAGNTVPAVNFYGNFWTVIEQFELNSLETVFEYAPDINGLKPIFPYIQSQETFWTTTYDPANSKWLRSRNTDRQDANTGIYLDWSIPLPINGNFETGDFAANLFIRSATTPQLPKALTKDGLPNSDPSGWTDTPPTGTDPLYEIRGQKDQRGNLKSAWIGPFLIPENEDLIRYNASSVPNPDTLANSTTVATTGSAADTSLITAGWVKLFDPTIHQYRAQRTETSPGNYTTWDIVKISGESGEYIDRIYKLFPINADFDSQTFINANTPTGNNPVANPQGLTRNAGWADTQYTETTTLINGYAEATKFIDGSLKTPWTSPKPFTGKDSYQDYIRSNGQTNFKYPSKADALAGTLSDPQTITLQFFLYKGDSEITTGLTYKWFKIYNDKNAIVVDVVNDTPLSTNKTLTVSPTDIATKAIFKCYAELDVTGGDNIIFEEEESITDITDGDDAKTVTLSTDTPIILYDTNSSEFSVPTVNLRAFQNFLDNVNFYWYKDNGSGVWESLTGNTDYTLANQSLQVATTTLFTSDGTKQTARFAISTSAIIANVEDVDEYYDVFTITKISSLGVGAPGADSVAVVLSNEVDSVILDRATLRPQTGEIFQAPSNYGTVTTLVTVYEGTTKLVQGTDYTVALNDTEPNITFGQRNIGGNVEVYINTWTATTVRKVSCNIVVTLTNSTTVTKVFTVSSNLDDAGALIPYIDVATDSVNKTLAFTPDDRTPIKLVARLDQNGTTVPAASLDGNTIWYFNNVITNTNLSGVSNINKIINRVDVAGALSIKAQIKFNGNTYTTTPITIDDITDAKNYILYHSFGTVPSEPIPIPSKPANTLVANFETAFPLTPSGTGYFRNSGNNSYFFSIGQVETIGGVDTIVFQGAIRNKGERGEQGPTPDFIVTYFIANETGVLPTLPQSNASRQQMLTAGWKQAPALTTGSFKYEASTTFNGSDINNLNAFATNNWTILDRNLAAPPSTTPTNSKTYFAGESRDAGPQDYIRIARILLSNSDSNATLKLGITSSGTGGSGILDVSVVRNAFIYGNNFAVTSHYNPSNLGEVLGGRRIVTELSGDQYLEIWLLTQFTPANKVTYSVLAEYTDYGESFTFYENDNSLTGTKPIGLIDFTVNNFVKDISFLGNELRQTKNTGIENLGQVVRTTGLTLSGTNLSLFQNNSVEDSVDLGSLFSLVGNNFSNYNNTSTTINFLSSSSVSKSIINSSSYARTAVIMGRAIMGRDSGGDDIISMQISRVLPTVLNISTDRFILDGPEFKQGTIFGAITIPANGSYSISATFSNISSSTNKFMGNPQLFYILL